MNTQIFVYKGMLGILSPENAKGIIARPGSGSMGFVVNTANIDISKEAKDAFNNAGREGGSFSDFMLTSHVGGAVEVHGKSSIGWLGGSRTAARVRDLKLGRDCDKSVLNDMNEVEVEIPADFKKYIDSLN